MSLTKDDLKAIKHLVEDVVDSKLDERFEEQNAMISQSFTTMQGSIDGLTERVDGLTVRVDSIDMRLGTLAERVDELGGQMDETLERVRNIEGHVEELYKRTETNDDERTVIGHQLTRSDERLDDHESRISKLEELAV